MDSTAEKQRECDASRRWFGRRTSTKPASRRLRVESLEPRLVLATIDVQIADSLDDAEEAESGAVYLNSSDLELVFDGYQSAGDQIVGMRFRSLGIPSGSTIEGAYVQFQVDETNNGATSLTIRGESNDDAAAFTAANGNISSRTMTTSSVFWSPPAWNSVGQAGSSQRTPDLGTVIQEIVDRPGWTSGSSLALIIAGTGERTAESFDGAPAAAPLLHVDYTPPAGSSIVDVRVSNSTDDAEEAESGSMYLDSSDLELVYDDFASAGDQTVGMRFQSLGIPQGATIQTAYVQFQADEQSTVATSLTIHGQATDDAQTFTSANANISSRPTTAESVAWSPDPWDAVGQAGAIQRTPDLKTVIQEIVDRPGFDSSSSLALIVTGTGNRAAESFDGDSSAAPLLHIEYTAAGGRPPTAVDDFASTPEDTAVVIDVLANDTDPDPGDVLSIANMTQGAHGTVANGGAYLVYTPAPGFVGTDNFTYTVTDGNGGFDTAAVAVTVGDTGNWTIVAIPDTQKYSQSSGLISRFEDQTNWIADNLTSRNIVFVSHEGDVVQNGGTVSEWQRADQAMAVLDGNLQANPDGLTPYSTVVGNHDYQIKGDRTSGADNYIQYFGPSRFSGRSWYGGSSANQLNHYQFFHAGGYTFLHLGLEWEAEGTTGDPSTPLGWAQSILNQFPFTPAIITTHSYIWDEPGQEGRTTFAQTNGGNSGEQIFQQLISPNDQIFMTLNGHWHRGPDGQDGEFHQVTANQSGHPVFEMLSNFQDYPNGGDGWLRTIEFQPGSGDGGADRIQVNTYSPTLDSFQTDSNSQFSFDLDFSERLNLAGSSNVDPHALTDWAATDENTSVSVEVLRNDFDPNPGDTVSLIGFTQAANGIVTQNGGALVYTPDPGFAGADSFSYSISDGNGGSATGVANIDVARTMQTVTFQNGQGGYTGTVDTLLQQASPDADNSQAAELNVDTDDPVGSGNHVHGLLRFDNIVGTDAGQIPSEVTIVSAALTLNTTNAGNGATLHRMLQGWDDTDTWNSLGAGVQANGVEARSQIELTTGWVQQGSRQFDVTSSVQAWANGESNLGWAMLPVDTNGWDFESSEGSTKPLLTVTYDASAELLRAWGGQGPGTRDNSHLSRADLSGLVDAALVQLAGVYTQPQINRLRSVHVEVVDLPDGQLGRALGSTVQIDVNGAGYGWFVDPTPFDNTEFEALAPKGRHDVSREARARMDLLTVLLHEFAHVLGEDHAAGSGLLGETLTVGTRHPVPRGDVL